MRRAEWVTLLAESSSPGCSWMKVKEKRLQQNQKKAKYFRLKLSLLHGFSHNKKLIYLIPCYNQYFYYFFFLFLFSVFRSVLCWQHNIWTLFNGHYLYLQYCRSSFHRGKEQKNNVSENYNVHIIAFPPLENRKKKWYLWELLSFFFFLSLSWV